MLREMKVKNMIINNKNSNNNNITIIITRRVKMFLLIIIITLALWSVMFQCFSLFTPCSVRFTDSAYSSLSGLRKYFGKIPLN